MQETRNNCFGSKNVGAYLFSPEEVSCYIFSTRNNGCEFLASDGFIFQSVIKPFFKRPSFGALLPSTAEVSMHCLKTLVTLFGSEYFWQWAKQRQDTTLTLLGASFMKVTKSHCESPTDLQDTFRNYHATRVIDIPSI